MIPTTKSASPATFIPQGAAQAAFFLPPDQLYAIWASDHITAKGHFVQFQIQFYRRSDLPYVTTLVDANSRILGSGGGHFQYAPGLLALRETNGRVYTCRIELLQRHQGFESNADIDAAFAARRNIAAGRFGPLAGTLILNFYGMPERDVFHTYF